MAASGGGAAGGGSVVWMAVWFCALWFAGIYFILIFGLLVFISFLSLVCRYLSHSYHFALIMFFLLCNCGWQSGSLIRPLVLKPLRAIRD